MSFTITKDFYSKEVIEEIGAVSAPILKTVEAVYTAVSINYGGKFIGDIAEVYFTVEIEGFSLGSATKTIVTQSKLGDEILKQAENELASEFGLPEQS